MRTKLLVGSLALILCRSAAAQLPRNQPTGLPSTRPNQPGTFGQMLPPRNNNAAAPNTAIKKPRDAFFYPQADGPLEYKNGYAILTGHVRLQYDGSVLTCDRATWEDKPNATLFTFEGNVTYDTGRETIYAEKIVFNRKTEEFVATDSRTILQPDRIGGSILQPLKIWGASLRRDGSLYHAEDGFLTTCDLDDPHAKIGFGFAELVPNKRLTLRDATIYRYDTVIARIKHLTIPLTETPKYSWLPTVGRTAEEGYFVKAVIGYSIAKLLPGLLRVDLMQKKGIGLGADQVYQFGQQAAGRVNVYTLNDKSQSTRSFSNQINHEQRLGEIDLNLGYSGQNNSYLAAATQSKTQNTTINLKRAVGPAGRQIADSVQLTLSDSASGTSLSRSANTTFNHSMPFRQVGKFELEFRESNSLNSFSSTRTTQDQQTGSFKLTDRIGQLDVGLTANRNLKNTSSSSVSGFNLGTEKLPELTVAANQLQGSVAQVFSRFQFAYGQYLDAVTLSGVQSQLNTGRYQLGADLKNFTVPISSNRTTLTATGRFQQSVYNSGAAAQYILNQNTNLSQQFSATGSFNLGYNYNRSYGGVPYGFRLDQYGSSGTNAISAGVRLAGGHATLSLNTTYDLIRARQSLIPGQPRAPWNTLTIGSELRPSGEFYTNLNAAYDPNTGRLTTVRNQLHSQRGDRFFLDSVQSYDPRLKKIRDVTANVATYLYKKDTRLIGFTAYDNVLHRFSQKNIAVTHSFHDYELTVSIVDQPFGFRTERGINLGLRLKAFPAPQSNTTGRFGTPVGGFSGGVF